MGSPPRRSVRDDLAALRIDRSEARSRPPWVAPLLVSSAVLVFVAGSWLAYRLTLGRVVSVRVDYVIDAGSDSPLQGEVLVGSGYVVTRDRYISLGARVPGRIERYLVDEGEQVRAGQLLVQLDPRRYEAALREAQASVRVAQANVDLRRKEFARLRELRSRQVSSEADLDVKLNQVRVAEAEAERLAAEVARLELDLEDAQLRAPTSGVILERLKEVGEIATPGGFAGSGDLIRMANLDELRAEIDVNEADLIKVRLGQRVEVTPDAYPERRYASSVVKLHPQINRQKGTLKVEVRIHEPDSWLRPDMSVRLRFLEEARSASPERGALLAPREALHSDAAGTFVWIVSGERLRRQAVSAGAAAPGNRVIIVRGLSGGEALVLGEAAGLIAGQRVAIEP